MNDYIKQRKKPGFQEKFNAFGFEDEKGSDEEDS